MTKQLTELQKPIIEMTDDELRSRILQLRDEMRISQTHVHQRAAAEESVKRTAKKRASVNVSEMTPEQAAALLAALGGGDDGSGT